MLSNFSYRALRYKYGLNNDISNLGDNFVVFVDIPNFKVAEVNRYSTNNYICSLASAFSIVTFQFKTFKECIIKIKEFLK